MSFQHWSLILLYLFDRCLITSSEKERKHFSEIFMYLDGEIWCAHHIYPSALEMQGLYFHFISVQNIVIVFDVTIRSKTFRFQWMLPLVFQLLFTNAHTHTYACTHICTHMHAHTCLHTHRRQLCTCTPMLFEPMLLVINISVQCNYLHITSIWCLMWYAFICIYVYVFEGRYSV